MPERYNDAYLPAGDGVAVPVVRYLADTIFEPILKLKRSKQAMKGLTNKTGVYALCDLDGIPIYVGQSIDGIRARVQRHLTSARSDIIANRQLDVWEIAYVMAWPTEAQNQISGLEVYLFHRFDKQLS